MSTQISRSAESKFRSAMSATSAAAILVFAASAQAQTTMTVTNLNDSGTGSLRDAIAGAAAGQPTIIGFQTGLTGTIPLQSTLTICGAVTLTIQGPGAPELTVSGQSNVQVLSICGGANVTISSLTIANGLVGLKHAGGGIYIEYSTLQLNDSVISNNQSTVNQAGGIYSYLSNISLTNSTVSGNSTTSGGAGGLQITSGTFIGRNCTISNNSAAGVGGAIVFTTGATASISNCTIANNSAGSGAMDNDFNSSITLKGTLLASNAGGNCVRYNGAAASQGYNVSDDNSCAFVLNVSTDKNNVAPGAGIDPKGLQDNGGPTKTVALSTGSPAVDIIPFASCTDASGNRLTADQRGISRPQGSACDAGAFELLQGIPFSSFAAQLVLSTGRTPGFALNVAFTLGATSNGINPATEALTLKIAGHSVTLTASSFHRLWNASQAPYGYSGTIGGTKLDVVLLLLGSNRYQLTAVGTPVNFAGVGNPVPVSLSIGDDAGQTSVNAAILNY